VYNVALRYTGAKANAAMHIAQAHIFSSVHRLAGLSSSHNERLRLSQTHAWNLIINV